MDWGNPAEQQGGFCILRPKRAYPASIKRPLTLAATLALGAASAHAGLILSPKGGITVFKAGDDEVAHQQLNETFTLFGHSFNSIDISTNGNINFSGNDAFQNVAFPSSGAGSMIAPLWDDFTLFQGSRVIAQEGQGWFAVTWRNMATWYDLDQRHSFQAIVFNTDRSFGGFDFHAGDIAFAYGPMGDRLNYDDAATVGLNGPGGHFAGLPGTGQTEISSAEIGKLEPFKTEFILYRPDGDGYDVSYQHTERAVPEPASVAVLGLGMFGLWRARRKKSA